ncbi:hypothetical protein BDN71DRAFT_1508229 [Pleurotus eryngii]|uniref:Uncharacterized protein n=1 Tax=Pleurotus eryngii TaxID=5323 RepID=A0A9P5ZTW9_PLEER|nr:hypothetical protein BDN71DRAFT_1508229 [Pleurotus eryngii]
MIKVLFIVVCTLAGFAVSQDLPVLTAQRLVNEVISESPFIVTRTVQVIWTQSPSIIVPDTVTTTSYAKSIGF